MGAAGVKVHLVSSARHFTDHLRPVWAALDASERGKCIVNEEALAYRTEFPNPNDPPLKAVVGRMPTPTLRLSARPTDIPLVASMRDFKRLLAQGHRPAYLAHGSGQTYNVEHPSYFGSIAPERAHARVFLVPNEHARRAIHAVHPRVRVEVVGVPKLDPWHRRPPKSLGARPVVAFGFHWDSLVCPETRTSWPHFAPGLAQVRARFEVLGHAHPRIWDVLEPRYTELGIEPVRTFDEVLERADVFVCDNSSTLFEFASTGRAVVVMNAPWYRRDVTHGLRFWECAEVGVNVDEPGELVAGIERALEHRRGDVRARERALAVAVPIRDGRAAHRAVEALRSLGADT
jgi:hypothetical protein